MLKQLTASAFVIHQGKVLMIFHKKLTKWLPPGGHVEDNEIPSDAAVREVHEETGYQIELFSDEHIWVQRWNANSLPRPYLCLLEEIPPNGETSAHQHIDLIYLGRLIGGTAIINEREIDSLRWFTLSEINALKSDIEIFEETQQVIRNILLKHNSITESISTVRSLTPTLNH